MSSYSRLSQIPQNESHNKPRNRAFTLVEVLVVTFISVVIFGALFMVLNMGEFQNRIGSARIDVQQRTRTLLDWIIRDMRQTSRVELDAIDVTDPTETVVSFASFGGAADVVFKEPDFTLCPGVGNPPTEQIKYEKDPLNPIVTRTYTFTDPGTGTVSTTTLRFNDVTNLVFTTTDVNSFRVDITTQRAAAGAVQTVTLSEVIRMRNAGVF